MIKKKKKKVVAKKVAADTESEDDRVIRQSKTLEEFKRAALEIHGPSAFKSKLTLDFELLPKPLKPPGIEA